VDAYDAEQGAHGEHDAPDVPATPDDDATGERDWVVLIDAVVARYATTSLEHALRVAAGAGEVAVRAGVRLRIDVRADAVTCGIPTAGPGRLDAAGVFVAREVARVVRVLGATPHEHGPQLVEVAVDALDGPAVQAFWRALLAYDPADIGWGDRARVEGGPAADPVRDPQRRGPSVWFQQAGPREAARNRVHLDVHVPAAHVEGRIAAAVAAGGRLVSDAGAPWFWVLADPEGNEACVCPAGGVPAER
jgi:4a-hydroxytetrahydrobiopterin dehydratase